MPARQPAAPKKRGGLLITRRAYAAEKKLRRLMSVGQVIALRKAVGDYRFAELGPRVAKLLLVRAEKKRERAARHTKRVAEKLKLSANDLLRVEIEENPKSNIEFAGIQPIKNAKTKKPTGWYTVFASGRVSRRVHGTKKAHALARRIEYQMRIASFARQYDLTFSEVRAFYREVKKANQRLRVRMRKRLARVKDPVRRKKIRRSLRLGALTSKGTAWEIQFLLRVLASP